jgi:hypothetical protein
MRPNLKKLGDIIKDENIFFDAPVSLQPDIQIRASTKQALENRIEKCQASLLACGFIPLMFEVERWTLSK